jgi:hypothetical protein
LVSVWGSSTNTVRRTETGRGGHQNDERKRYAELEFWNTEEGAKKEGDKRQDKQMIGRGGSAWNSDEREKTELE